MSSPQSTLLSVGATGSIGRYVVDEALRQGYAVRALVRDLDKARELPPQIEVVDADLTHPDSLASAVSGINAIVFTHGTDGGGDKGAESVDYGGVRNVLVALGGRKVRIALMTAIGVTDRAGAHDWKRRGERLVRASGLPYTIVRPGWFDYNQPDQHRLVLLQGDKRQSGTPRDGVVARHQLAQVLVHSLQSPNALLKTFELIAETGPQPKDFDALFATADPDVERALDGAHDAANMPLNEEPQRVAADLKEVLARSDAGAV
jgi:uncharacterized protein YbjT (DUF2867 family)